MDGFTPVDQVVAHVHAARRARADQVILAVVSHDAAVGHVAHDGIWCGYGRTRDNQYSDDDPN